jgi:hypothetical protein
VLAAAHAKRVRADYSTLARFVRDFLEAQLKGRVIAAQHLATRHRDAPLGAAPHVEFVAKGAGPPPAPPLAAFAGARLPTPRELRPLLARDGATALAALLRRLHAAAGPAGAATIYHPILGFALVYELGEQGKADDARTLGRVWADFVPEFLGEFLAIGGFYGGRGNRDFARSCFERLLLLDPENAEAKRSLAALGRN